MNKEENEKSNRKQILIRCSEEEFNLIEANANAMKRVRNIYIKEMALHGTVVKFDYKYFDENNRLMNEIENDINLLIYTILKTSEYFSIDLENINNSLQKIINNQEIILKEIRKETRNLKRILKENVQEIKVEENKNDNQECF